MNKIIVVNKEKRITSRDVVNKLNKILNTKKIGHTGTLDPLATGVLVICVGKALKLVELITSAYKEYIAEIKLGLKTTTGDITGEILETKKSPLLKEEEIKKVLLSFLGESIQEVPLYSAVKVKGKKLYEYARNNEIVSLPKRKIEIKSIELLSYDKDIIKFKVLVSKGTYIRSLIQDICTKLNVIGTMNNLVRTKQGDFTIEESYTLEDIEKGNYKYLRIEDILKTIPRVDLDASEYEKIKNGAIIANTDNNKLTAYFYQNNLIALYQIYAKDKSKKKPYKMFL